MQLPIVEQLRAKNKRLKKQNKQLVQILLNKLQNGQIAAPCGCPSNFPDVSLAAPVPPVVVVEMDSVLDVDEILDEAFLQEDDVADASLEPNVHYELEEMVEEEEVEEEEVEEEVEVEEEEVEEEVEVEEEEEEEEVEEVEEEEEVEEAEEGEEEEEVEEEEEEVEVEEVEEGEEEGLEVEEVVIHGKTYFASNTTNGDIYAMDADGEVGDKVGAFVQGKAKLG